MALAHAVGNEVEAAYRRGDLFDKRRHLMDEWAAFCSRPCELRAEQVEPAELARRMNVRSQDLDRQPRGLVPWI